METEVRNPGGKIKISAKSVKDTDTGKTGITAKKEKSPAQIKEARWFLKFQRQPIVAK